MSHTTTAPLISHRGVGYATVETDDVRLTADLLPDGRGVIIERFVSHGPRAGTDAASRLTIRRDGAMWFVRDYATDVPGHGGFEREHAATDLGEALIIATQFEATDRTALYVRLALAVLIGMDIAELEPALERRFARGAMLA